MSIVIPVLFFFDARFSSDLIIGICYATSYFYLIGIIFQFICPVVACRDRMRIISSRVSAKFRLNSFEIQNYVQLYRRLLRIVDDINKHLTAPLLPILAYLFISITFEFYAVVRLIFRNTDFKLLVGVSAALWTLVLCLPFIVVIHAAESAMEEIDKIKDVGFDALCCQKVFDAQSEKTFNIFITSIDRTRLQFRTIFFNLDWQLLFKVSFSIYTLIEFI